MSDLTKISQGTVYDPANYYERVLRTALQLVPHPCYRASFVDSLKLAWTFCKVSVKAGFNLRTGPLYWKTLFTVLAANPRATEAAISMAALYIHFGRQSEFVTRMVELKIADIEQSGEEDYNERMIAGMAPVSLSANRPLPRPQAT